MGVVSPERERTAPPPVAPEPPQPPPPPPHRGRGISWGGVVALVLVLSLIAGVNWVRDIVPSFDNPFAQETTVRTGPALLESIQDIGEYRAAAGNFQVIVDLEKDSRLPDEILGERTLFVAVGSVDAGVDLASVGPGDVRVSEDRLTAVVTLPAARLYEAELDLDESYVYERDRGLFNRIGSAFSDDAAVDQQVYTVAEERLNQAAHESGDLERRAEENTRRMVESLLRSLGFTDVTVRFASGG